MTRGTDADGTAETEADQLAKSIVDIATGADDSRRTKRRRRQARRCPISEHPPRSLFHRSCFDVQLVVTRRAFIALERPVGMVDWMLGHPFSNADLALDHAALKGDVALVAVGDDFFDAVSGASRQNMTENGNKRHEHQAFLAPAVPTCKADASRGDEALTS